jgi:type IV secretory pathway TrbD component
MLGFMGSSLTFHFGRGFVLGLLIGMGLGFLASSCQKALGLPLQYLNFDLWVGAFFGLMAGWCFALQTVLKKALKDLFFFLSKQVPWLADALALDWVSRLRDIFTVFSSKAKGAPRWFLGRWILSRLSKAEPFLTAVVHIKSTWKKKESPTPQELAYEAMGILLQPLDAAFAAAYALLLLGALLFWSLPFIVRMVS